MIKEKRMWITPGIMIIEWFNELSRQLPSDANPTEEPNRSKTGQHAANDPYKMA